MRVQVLVCLILLLGARSWAQTDEPVKITVKDIDGFLANYDVYAMWTVQDPATDEATFQAFRQIRSVQDIASARGVETKSLRISNK